MPLEEIFGPVLVAIPRSNEEETIRMANDTHYRLAAYVWPHDIGRRAASAIEAGWVQTDQGLCRSPGSSLWRLQAKRQRLRVLAGAMLESYTQRNNVPINLIH